MEIRPNRTDTYVCSLDPSNESDMKVLDVLRKAISVANKAIEWETTGYGRVRKCKRVTVKGRDPIVRQCINVNHWWQQPDMQVRSYNRFGDIVGDKYTNSKRLDIYVHNDYRWENNY